MADVTFNPKFKETLECPICFDFYTPPVSLCPNGHSICDRCRKQSKICPVCRAQYTLNSRNRVVEAMLENVLVPCKFEGCGVRISLAERLEHVKVCAFNNFLRCLACSSYEEDLVRHLIDLHDYKEISMEDTGGVRSFSGPYDSWVRDTDWPRGVWKFGAEPIIVHAKSISGVFHVYLFRTCRAPLKIRMKVENTESSIKFSGVIPHVNEFTEKGCEPHFNSDVSVLLHNFVKEHEDDEEILRLWVTVTRALAV